jgi:hypothetical protein
MVSQAEQLTMGVQDMDKGKVLEFERLIFDQKKVEKTLEKKRLDAIQQTKNTKLALQQIFDATGDNVDDLNKALLRKQDDINHDFNQIELLTREMDAQVRNAQQCTWPCRSAGAGMAQVLFL